MSASPDACVVWIEVDGRQRYLFESDKLAEMLGASRVIAETVEAATTSFKEFKLFQLVSGEIGVWAPITDRVELLSATWKFRNELQEQGLEVTCGYRETYRVHFEEGESKGGDLAGAVIRPLKRITKAAKSRKTLRDAGPSSSLFAPCRLHGWEFATHWNPREEKEVRRQLRGHRATEKLRAWTGFNRAFYKKELQGPILERVKRVHASVDLERPITFTNLSDGDDEAGQDQFVAFICADGDGMGEALSKLNWNKDDATDTARTDKAPWERNRDFATELDAAFKTAFRAALVEVLLPDGDTESATLLASLEEPVVHIPMLPQLMGGDDLWIVCRRDVALDFACRFSNEFHKRYPSLTLSLGVAFAKAGYPAYAMIGAAEALLKEAKWLRKGHAGRPKPEPPEGCLDWHWIESSISQGVTDARQQGLKYSMPFGDEARHFQLTTRPWTVSQTGAFVAAEREFRRIARRKREQLEPILRLGLERSRLQWERWCKSLEEKELKALALVQQALADWTPLDSAPNHIPTGFWPWHELSPAAGVRRFVTPFLDLLELAGPLKEKGVFFEEKAAFKQRKTQERANA